MSSENNNATGFLAGGGEMGELIRSYNWSATPLGGRETWPQSLKTAVGIMLHSPYPMFVWWGKEMIMFHNDGFVPVLGKRHPEALGKSGPEIWSDVWDFIGPLMHNVLEKGQPSYFERQLLIPERKGFKEETYFTFSYSPIPNDQGGVGGIFCVCSEDTNQVLNQRRLSTLQDLSELTNSENVEEVFDKASQLLGNNLHDMPFGLFYKVNTEATHCNLTGAFGVTLPAKVAPLSLSLDTTAEQLWPVPLVNAADYEPVLVKKLSQKFTSLPTGPWDNSPEQAIILPIKKAAQDQVVGFFISAISPRLEFNEAYQSFLNLVASQVATAIANVSVLEEERQRQQKLIELDQAKTSFFNNISHEFRTPLTLMLGPLQDLLSETSTLLPEFAREQLTVAYQNSKRLLKLVNTLLEFSRLEAGRVQVTYQPTDLGAYTAEIASAFESAIKKAGLEYQVECSALTAPVYVDPDLWERIVLNLISNAFKYTPEGRITVKLDESEAHARFIVQDTGVGIPEEELPNLFKRFHRIQNSFSRSFEGTGIGLALVKELVELHAGTIDVASTPGKGTTFTISIPKRPLTETPIAFRAEPTEYQERTRTRDYVNEAVWWGKQEYEPEELTEKAVEAGLTFTAQVPDNSTRILVADDNADMRHYLTRILNKFWRVEAVRDGEEALAAIKREMPDLVLSDVMMPKMDGLELLAQIREDNNISQVPVILLSARAGEEETLEGLAKGANDYVVKPFSAGELLARVRTQLEILRTRQDNVLLKKAEEELKKFKFISDYAFDAFILMREDGTFAYLNDLALQRWGYTREEAQHIRVPDVDPIYQEEKFNQAFALAQKQGAILPFETLHKHKDGTVYPVEVSMGGITLDGKPHMFAVARDITERKQAEQALLESENQFRTFANNIQNLAWMAEPDGYIFWYNQRWYDYTGTTLEEMQGWGWEKVHHPDHINRVVNFVKEAWRKEETWELTFPLKGADNQYRWFLTRAYAVKDRNGKVVRWIGTNTDIEEQKRAEEEFKTKNAELQKTNNDLDNFIYTASHDLKAPITNIEGLMELLVSELPAETMAIPVIDKVVSLIQDSIGRFRNTIRDLTEISKLHRDIEDDVSQVYFSDIFDEIRMDLETNIQKSGAGFQLDFSQCPFLRFSKKNLRSILYNLVSNAIKYTSPERAPFIKITTGIEQDFCVLSVEDNGLGMDLSQESKIFSMFKRLHDHVEGSGIGLYIVKRIVENSGGKIKVESEIGMGSTFKIYFQL